MIHPKAIITLAAIVAFPAFVIFTRDGFAQSNNGAVIHIESKADGFNEQGGSPVWTLGKFHSPEDIQVLISETATVNYTITATKTAGSGTATKSAQGEVCVKNTGKQATEGLTITNQVEYRNKGFFKELTSASLTQTPDAVAPGKTGCTSFKIVFNTTDGTKYRVKSEAKITNFGKKNNKEIIRRDTDGFSIPQAASITSTEATIIDEMECPEGYTCTASDPGPWKISDTKSITYTVSVTNNTADCSNIVSLANFATLTVSTSNNKLTSGESIPINSPPCSSQ